MFRFIFFSVPRPPAMDASLIHTVAVAVGSLALAAFLAWFVK